jgi:DNA-binding CsgD family transcriptional regulator
VTLTVADLEALVTVLPALYQADDLDQFPLRVLGVMQALIPGDGYSYNDVNAAAGTNVGVVDRTDRITPELRRFFERHLDEHPAVAHFIETSDRRAHAISDFISREQFRRRPIYAELYRHLHVEDQLSIGVGTAPRFIGLCVNRDRWGFTAQDRLLLELLGFHVRAAYHAASERALTNQIATAGGLGIVRVSPDGQCVQIDDLARASLAAGFDGWLSSSRRLPDELGDWVKVHLRGFELDPGAPLLPLVVERRHIRLHIRLVPGPSATGWSLVIRGEIPPPSQPVAPRLRLTPRERQVLQLLETGASSQAIADALVVSRHTVHRHLQNLYDKLGVRGRLAAVAKAREAHLSDGP